MLLEIGLSKRKKTTQNKKTEKKIKIASSLGYPSSYFYNKRCNMFLLWLYLSFSWLYKVAPFCQCQCHSSCLRTWSIHNNNNNNNYIYNNNNNNNDNNNRKVVCNSNTSKVFHWLNIKITFMYFKTNKHITAVHKTVISFS